MVVLTKENIASIQNIENEIRKELDLKDKSKNDIKSAILKKESDYFASKLICQLIQLKVKSECNDSDMFFSVVYNIDETFQILFNRKNDKITKKVINYLLANYSKHLLRFLTSLFLNYNVDYDKTIRPFIRELSRLNYNKLLNSIKGSEKVSEFIKKIVEEDNLSFYLFFKEYKFVTRFDIVHFKIASANNCQRIFKYMYDCMKKVDEKYFKHSIICAFEYRSKDIISFLIYQIHDLNHIIIKDQTVLNSLFESVIRLEDEVLLQLLIKEFRKNSLQKYLNKLIGLSILFESFFCLKKLMKSKRIIRLTDHVFTLKCIQCKLQESQNQYLCESKCTASYIKYLFENNYPEFYEIHLISLFYHAAMWFRYPTKNNNFLSIQYFIKHNLIDKTIFLRRNNYNYNYNFFLNIYYNQQIGLIDLLLNYNIKIPSTYLVQCVIPTVISKNNIYLFDIIYNQYKKILNGISEKEYCVYLCVQQNNKQFLRHLLNKYKFDSNVPLENGRAYYSIYGTMEEEEASSEQEMESQRVDDDAPTGGSNDLESRSDGREEEEESRRDDDDSNATEIYYQIIDEEESEEITSEEGDNYISSEQKRFERFFKGDSNILIYAAYYNYNEIIKILCKTDSFSIGYDNYKLLVMTCTYDQQDIFNWLLDFFDGFLRYEVSNWSYILLDHLFDKYRKAKKNRLLFEKSKGYKPAEETESFYMNIITKIINEYLLEYIDITDEKYNDDKKNQCIICFNDFKKNDIIFSCNQCSDSSSHIFCQIKWFVKQMNQKCSEDLYYWFCMDFGGTCPGCRKEQVLSRCFNDCVCPCSLNEQRNVICCCDCIYECNYCEIHSKNQEEYTIKLLT